MVKILVVDDEKIVAKSIGKLLTKEGYQVLEAQDSRQALEQLKGNRVALVISDVRLPTKNGIELLKEIRAYLKESGKPKIGEILITGYADIGYYQEAAKLGVKGYLYKPFDNKELIKMVKEIIEKEKNEGE